VQLVDQSGSLGDRVVAVLVESRKDGGRSLGDDGVGITTQSGDPGRCGGVDDIVFASATPGKFSNPCRRGRRHGVDDLAAGGEPLSQMPPQPARVFHRPLSSLAASRLLEEPTIPVQRDIGLQRDDHSAGVGLHRAGGASAFVWINSDDD
jgi:hypothetical protein